MPAIHIAAYGKVNLSLNITGVRENMHTLDGVVACIDLHDDVCVNFNSSGKANVRFENCAQKIPERNSVTEAVRFLRIKEPTLGADVTVTKRIPIAAGLGGSSADAAAVVRAAALYMPEIFGGEDTAAESVAIGSDVPVLVSGGCALMRGIGDEIRPIAAPALYLCLARGEGGVNSGEAYKLFDGLYPDKRYVPSDTDALVRALGAGDIKEVARHTHNALALPAEKLCASVRSALDALKAVGALNASVTGSGNCCFGIFGNKEDADAAAQKIAALGFFTASVRTLADKI